MSKVKDETGNRYGKLVVTERVFKTDSTKAFWNCVCDCGNTRVLSGEFLRGNKATSCLSCRGKLKRNRKGKGKPNPTGGKRLKNEVGNRYGRLTVISYAGTRSNGRGGAVWKCMCDCGNETTVCAGSLRGKTTRSCGCLSHSPRGHLFAQMGLSETKEYEAWHGMITRCYKSRNARDHKNYQERGITVCDRWKNSFQAFLEDMGKHPGKGYSLDRIDNDGSYSPENCRWATRIEQMNNKRNNRVITYSGSDFTVAQLERKLGLPQKCLSKKLSYYHGDVEKAVKAAEKSARRNAL